MTEIINIEDLNKAQSRKELARLARILLQANDEYYRADAPKLSDADYDRLKLRNAAIESRFPDLKRSDSPSDQIGARAGDGFAKAVHSVRMLSLGNAFDDQDVADFDKSVRKYLGLGAGAALAYTAEPKIDGLSLS
ncbi:MAG: NAD-dependent DNA ligase LigA, partial [Rhodobacteraceae bacterium]|nr:NAD-dependent DNA ligase LigA [Paracoccaceae bacterium]